MEKTFEGIFELFNSEVRRLANGNKLRIVLECTENTEVEKSLIDFRGEMVEATITQLHVENEKRRVTLKAIFEVYDLKCRRLRNGDKLMIVLESLYDENGKSNEKKTVDLKFDECKVFLVKIDQELPFEETKEE